MSDEDEYWVKKAFPVEHLLKGQVKLRAGEAPADAIEYLKFVAHEASQCKDVVVASIDEKKLKKQTVIYSNTLKEANPQAVLPSREWKICQVSDFSALRTNLAKMKMCSSASSKRLKLKDLPRRNDERSWCIFCLGSIFARTIPEYEGINNDDETEAHRPLARIICSLDQPIIEKLIEYHISWLKAGAYSVQQGLWIYSLMAGLELPLTPDVCSLLRGLARSCATSRDQIKEASNEESVVSLNLIICLVSKYFRQLDLEDI